MNAPRLLLAYLAQDRALSIEDKSEFAELVLDVFDRALFTPGDWHTGMNMLQAIFKIYWHMIIKHFKVWLKIARLSKDVSKCYYEQARLFSFAIGNLLVICGTIYLYKLGRLL